MNLEDISHFYTKSSRKDNDSVNKLRENILVDILTGKIPAEFYLDERWIEIKTKLMNCLDLYGFVLKDNIIKKGGMGNNYDFQLTDDITYHIEFKCNNVCVSKLPQFLELFDRDICLEYNMTTTSYSEYYYMNYLDKYLETDSFVVPKPTLDEYVKCVRDIKYKHPFIRQLYDKKESNKKKKVDIVSASIKNYLLEYSPKFDFTSIEKKIRDSQQGKIYLFWTGTDFTIQEVDISAIKIGNLIDIKPKCFTIEVEGFEYNIEIRLNWGNNNGIANPRWKFTFKKPS